MGDRGSRVALLGAFDRFNYGDLLFPLVLERALSHLGMDAQYELYGLIASDLSRYGARPTVPIRRLPHDHARDPFDAVIVVGGETIGARWTNMAIYASSAPTSWTIRGSRKILGPETTETLVRRVLRAPGRRPWLLGPDDLSPPVPILYNAVGGSTNLESMSSRVRHEVAATLAQATRLAVRDRSTAESLRKLGLENVTLVPDTAVLMADLFPSDWLEGMVSDEVLCIRDAFPHGYLCLQANQPIGSTIAADLIEPLEEMATRFGLGVVLLPIGRATMHEDQRPLRQIGSRLSTPHVFAGEDLGIFDIMFLISRADVFVGTSLHGAITALAFEVPHFALTGRVPKLMNFLDTWDAPGHRIGAEPDGILDAVEAVTTVPGRERANAKAKAAELVWKHFHEMAKDITGASARSVVG